MAGAAIWCFISDHSSDGAFVHLHQTQQMDLICGALESNGQPGGQCFKGWDFPIKASYLAFPRELYTHHSLFSPYSPINHCTKMLGE